MAEYKVNAMPVVTDKGHVIGMVSEADMLRKQERTFGRLGTGLARRTRHQRDQAEARTAGGLMTSPAITIHPDAPLGAADLLARLQAFGLADKIGEDRLFPTLPTAVEAYQEWARANGPSPGGEGAADG